MSGESGWQPGRVLMTADSVGGVWQYALELSGALCRNGVRVALATMGRRLSAAQHAEIAAIPGIELFESGYRLEWMQDPWKDVERAGDWLLELDRTWRPDIVHLNGYVHAALPWGAPVLVVGHSCVLSWWRAVKGEEPPGLAWDRYRSAVGRGLKAASVVAAPSLAMLCSLAQYGVSQGRVIYNSRSASRFSPANKSKFILSAGRLWDEAKNLAVLDRAAGNLPWPVVAAGSQTAPDGSTVHAVNLNMLGELNSFELAAHMSRASIFAAPARYEPFGLSILEAALSGCALVLGDIESLREIWGDAAIFVRPDDSGALRAALQELIYFPALRAQLASQALQRARRLTPERMLEGYIAAYGELDRRAASRGAC